MDAETRKTLEALIDRADHAGAWGSGSAFDAAAAIRAALAEVDALTQQVADLKATMEHVATRLDRRWQSETWNGDEDARALRAALSAAKEAP